MVNQNSRNIKIVYVRGQTENKVGLFPVEAGVLRLLGVFAGELWLARLFVKDIGSFISLFTDFLLVLTKCTLMQSRSCSSNGQFASGFKIR